MTRKSGRKSRGGSRRKRAQKRLFSLERGLFKTISIGLFVLAFLGFIYIGLSSGIVIVAALAGIAIFLWGAVALPVDRFQATGEYLWSGEFGEDLHDFWTSLIPGRGRGQVTTSSAITMFATVAAALLVASAVLPGIVAAQENNDEIETTHDCETSIYYDEFRTNQEVVDEANESGSAAVVKQNTRVKINDSDAFYRITAENPNSYCVEMTADVSEEIFPPTNLGEVDSLDKKTVARWTDVHDFETQTAHTELTFTVPANSTVKFAPSKPTVFLPAWRDSQKREAEGLLDRVTDYSPFGDDEEGLEKRVYTFNGSDRNSVPVRLDNPNESEQRIEEWNAVYRLSPDEPWKPVDTDTEDPVYYRELGDDKVEFVMNDNNAVIEFRANPTTKDEIVDDVRSYRRSFHDLSSFWPLTTTSAGVTVA